MSIGVFILLLTVFSTITCLGVEACKKILDEAGIKYHSNIVACVVGCIVGFLGTVAYYMYGDIPYNVQNIITAFLMGVADSVGAMVGYDKVIQTINQIKK